LSDSTREGQAENRRVVVKILQNKLSLASELKTLRIEEHLVGPGSCWHGSSKTKVWLGKTIARTRDVNLGKSDTGRGYHERFTAILANAPWRVA
jgi:hypothetical protein